MIRGSSASMRISGEVALPPLLAVARRQDRALDELRFLERQHRLQADAARLTGFEKQQVATAGGLRQRQVPWPRAELVERLGDLRSAASASRSAGKRGGWRPAESIMWPLKSSTCRGSNGGLLRSISRSTMASAAAVSAGRKSMSRRRQRLAARIEREPVAVGRRHHVRVLLAHRLAGGLTSRHSSA
jgi:hypothetical protein